MADSTKEKLLAKWRRWKARNPSYPLSVNANGQWSKKVLGKKRCFGKLEDPQAALKKWNKEKDYLLAGVEPPRKIDGMTLGQLCDKHMADCEDRIAVGKLAQWTKKDYSLARRQIDSAGIADVPLKALGPQHFTELQKAIDKSGLRLRTQKNAVNSIMTILNWGVSTEYLEALPNTGPRFGSPTSTAIEVEQEEQGVIRFFDREILVKALKMADARMKVVILLGINCAFYPQDTESITLDHFNLDHAVPHVDFRRVKTGRPRRAALWPETVKAIEQYLATREPEDPSERTLLLNQYGRRYTKKSAGKSTSRLFDDLIRTAGKKPAGASLGSLRHTCATIMDLAHDQPMVDLVMGHVPGGQQNTRKVNLQRRIYSQMNVGELDRLNAVAEVVRKWLYDGEINGVKTRGSDDRPQLRVFAG